MRAATVGTTVRGGRRRGARRDHRRRVRRPVHPPHRPRHRPRGARGPVHRRRQRGAARARPRVQHRARDLLPGPLRAPARGHRRGDRRRARPAQRTRRATSPSSADAAPASCDSISRRSCCSGPRAGCFSVGHHPATVGRRRVRLAAARRLRRASRSAVCVAGVVGERRRHGDRDPRRAPARRWPSPRCVARVSAVRRKAGRHRPGRVPAARSTSPRRSSGLVAVLAAAVALGGDEWLAAARLVVGAAFLGCVTDAMLLGHWYLVQPGLPREPIKELVRSASGSRRSRSCSCWCRPG